MRIVSTRLLILGASLLGLAAPAHAADPMKITVTGLVSGFADYFIAIDRGYFAEENIDAQIIQAGGAAATPALLSGDVQFSTSASIAIGAILRGGELKIVYVNNDHVPYQLWSGLPDIKTLADLKAKQVGIETRGDTRELAVRAAMVAAKLDPSTVVFTPMANASALVASVMVGSLASATVVTDEIEKLKAVPTTHMVYDLQTIGTISGGGVFSNELIKNNRGLAERFMKAVVKGRRDGRAFVNHIVDAVRKRNPGLSADDILLGVNAQRPLMTKDGTIPISLQQNEIDARSEFFNIPPEKRVKPAQAFDFTLLKEANDKLDAEGWKPKP